MVPVLLLLTLAALGGQIFYSQLGGYLLYEDVHSRLGRMTDSAASIAGAEASLPAAISDKVVEEALDAQIRIAYAKELPGLKIEFHADPKRLARVAGPGAKEFTGILQSNGQTHLIAMRELESPRGKSLVELSVRVTPEFLETVAPDLGPIQVTALQRADGGDSSNAAARQCSLPLSEQDFHAPPHLAECELLVRSDHRRLFLLDASHLSRAKRLARSSRCSRRSARGPRS
jgi:hypothetical protein